MIAAEDDGAGILAAGACPVLLIIFSLLFAAVILSVPALKRLIGKKYPLLAEEENALKLQYESERKNETAARGNAAAFRESHTPVCTAEPLQASTDEQISLQAAEPAAKKQKPARLPKPAGLTKTVNKYMHFKRQPFSLLFCLFYSQLPFCSFSILSAVPHSIIWRNAPFLPRPSYSTRSVVQSGSFWQTNASENGNLRKRAKAPA